MTCESIEKPAVTYIIVNIDQHIRCTERQSVCTDERGQEQAKQWMARPSTSSSESKIVEGDVAEGDVVVSW